MVGMVGMVDTSVLMMLRAADDARQRITPEISYGDLR